MSMIGNYKPELGEVWKRDELGRQQIGAAAMIEQNPGILPAFICRLEQSLDELNELLSQMRISLQSVCDLEPIDIKSEPRIEPPQKIDRFSQAAMEQMNTLDLLNAQARQVKNTLKVITGI